MVRLSFEESHPFLHNPYRSYPVVPIRLNNRGRVADTVAMIDTGADVCLFHSKWAQKVGLRLKAGRLDVIGGIEGGPGIECYVHRITLMVGYAGKKIRCEVAFSEEIGEDIEDQLIGREIVFDRMRFAFRQGQSTFYVGHSR